MMTEYDPNHGHGDQDQFESPQQSQQRSTILERGRSVKLLRNGDPFFRGRAFVINHRKYPMLDVFLDDASQALRANFGAVRCLYTPKNGTRLHDISELEDHQLYVASGGERFKKLHYLDVADGKRIPYKERSSQRLPPVRRFDVEGRALKLSRSENVIIYVYRNGDPLTLPAKILLVKSTLQNWESVLDEITRKVSLPSSAVLKLYAMNGELITSAQQLEYNGMYVAAGKERFKRIEYPDPKTLSPNSSPKMSRKSSNHQFSGNHAGLQLPPPRQRRFDDQNDHYSSSILSTQNRYTKSDGTLTHTTTANSHGSNEYIGQRRPVREEYDFFNSKPQQHRRGPTKETDLDRDDGGIYKGRLNHRERVREVDETRDTKVDLPVNYREVETVEEENLFGNAGKTPRRHQQPPPSQLKTNQGFANARQHSPPSPPIPPKTNQGFANSRQHSPPPTPPKNHQPFANSRQYSPQNQHKTNQAFANSRQHSPPPTPPKNHQAFANARQHSPPPSTPPKVNQGFANSRQHSPPPPPRHIKTPPKSHHDDDDDNNTNNNSRFSMHNDNHHNTKNNGYDHDYRRPTPPARPVHDEINYDQDDGRASRSPPHRREIASPNSQSNKTSENQAATVIQSHVRGYLTRKQMHHEKEQHTDRSTNDHEQQQQDKAHKHEQNQQEHTSQKKESPDSMIEHLANMTAQRAIAEASVVDDENEDEYEERRHGDDDDENV